MNKTSKILKEGLNDKVLVAWIKDDKIIEYSIHTKALTHTDDNHNLIYGCYYDNLEKAKNDFEYYIENSSLRNIIKNINDTVESWVNDESCWLEHDDRIGILSICNGNEDEVYSFQGEGYDYLVSEYEKSCVSTYVNFVDYVIYDSQNW